MAERAMENVVSQLSDKVESDANDMQLPTVAPTAEPAPKRAYTLQEKLAVILTTIIVSDSVFTSLTFSFLFVSATLQTLTGIMLVSIWEAVVQRSLESFPAFNALPRIYWHYLRTTGLGDFILSVGVGLVIGTSFAMYHLYTKGFPAQKDNGQERVDAFKRAKSGRSSVLAAVLVTVLGTAAMPTGIVAIRWWNGSSVDAVTENYVRSTVLAFVGTTTHTSYGLYKKYKKANKAGVKLTGDDEVLLDQTEGAQGADQDVATRV